MPRSFNAAAMARRLVAPAACSSRYNRAIGDWLKAQWSRKYRAAGALPPFPDHRIPGAVEIWRAATPQAQSSHRNLVAVQAANRPTTVSTGTYKMRNATCIGRPASISPSMSLLRLGPLGLA
jgi:hypothetical protein